MRCRTTPGETPSAEDRVLTVSGGLLVVAAATLAVGLLLDLVLVRGLRSLPALDDAGSPGSAPRVSIIFAARDEAPHVAAALETMLNQDYPDFEVVAVDDRSTDGTGGILDAMAAANAALRTLHVDALPDGWLGKNHALQRGAETATGELLLFTDADVEMSPDALSKAVAFMEREGLDHVAAAPRIHSGTAVATLVVTVFLAVFATFFRPWKARDPDSRSHIGIGAFNMVRAEAYRAIGGHGAVSLRPDEDVRLGRALKAAGYRQAAALGNGVVKVEWYPSFPAMARGLRKNAFAVVDYRLYMVVAWTAVPVVFVFWPVAALFVTGGLTWWLNLAIVLAGAATFAETARVHGLPRWTGATYPVGSLLLTWVVWSAALRVLRRGTVEWRGTEYALEELRRGR